MTKSHSEIDDLREQLSRAQAMVDALGRTLYTTSLERDVLRIEVHDARVALGGAWLTGSLADGITRKCQWLEAMAGEVDMGTKHKVRTR
jgi:hypothetical protein